MANILDTLDSLIKQASAVKAGQLKAAESVSAKLDGAEDGTTEPSTGEHAAAMAAEQDKTYPDNAVETGAKTNTAGASVSASTTDATAVSTSGNEGAQGSELAGGELEKADNGPEGVMDKVAAARWLAGELRKQASAMLSPLDRYLAGMLQNSSDAQIKTAAAGMDEMELADAAADGMQGDIGSGNMSEEDAAAVLQDMVASGAVSEEELSDMATDMLLEGLESGEIGEEQAAQILEAGLASGEISEDDLAGAATEPGQEKVASARSELSKIAAAYPDAVQAGYGFAVKLAEEMAAESEGEEEAEEEKEEEEKAEEAPASEEAAAPAPAVEEAATDIPAPSTAEEAAALAAVQQELGIDDATMSQLMAAEAAPMDKTAAAKAKYRSAVLNKIAALNR